MVCIILQLYLGAEEEDRELDTPEAVVLTIKYSEQEDGMSFEGVKMNHDD